MRVRIKSKRYLSFFFSVLLLFLSLCRVDGAGSALHAASALAPAEDLSGDAVLTGADTAALALDRNHMTAAKLTDGFSLSAENGKGYAAIYLTTEKAAPEITVEDGKTSRSFPATEYLHQTLDLKAAFGYLPQKIRLTFADPGCGLTDVWLFSDGELPSFCQDWDAPAENADLLLISAHSDDDTLFFAGLLPYYASVRGLTVQVAYLTNHSSNANYRNHELLNGLWEMGVRCYPILSEFPDLYSESLDEAKQLLVREGYPYDAVVDFVVKTAERTHPQLIVTHDTEGEYGHGAHRLAAAAVMDACGRIAASPDGSAEENARKVKKVYLHLYPENKVSMNWDEPFDALGGRTPFLVSQDAFACHKSQHWTWLYNWIYYGWRKDPPEGTPRIGKAADLKSYSPCEYGLWFSSVGADEAKNDLFEHLTSYADQAAAKKEEEESRQAEESRLAEESRKAAEESLRAAEESRKAAESRDAVTTAPAADPGAPKKEKTVAAVLLAAALLTAAVLLVFSFRKH